MPGPDRQGSFGDEQYYMGRLREILQRDVTNGSVYSSALLGVPPPYPVQLLDHVYIGNQRNADNLEVLRRLGITHVLNCAGLRRFDFTRSPYPKDAGIKGFLMISAEDHEDYDIRSHFEEAVVFLDGVKRNRGRALVHCNLGVNRSGAVVAAYIMASEKRTLLDVARYLKSKRSIILSNRGFRRQLIRYARELSLLDPLGDDDDTDKDGTSADVTVNKSSSNAKSAAASSSSSSSAGTSSTFGRFRSPPTVIIESNGVDERKLTNQSESDPNGSRLSTSSKSNSWFLSPVYERPERSTNGSGDADSVASMFGGFLTLLGGGGSGRRKPFRSTSYSNMTSCGSSAPAAAAASTSEQLSADDEEVQVGQSAASKSLSTARPLRIYTRSSTDSALYRPPSARAGSGGGPGAPEVVSQRQRFGEQHRRPLV